MPLTIDIIVVVNNEMFERVSTYPCQTEQLVMSSNSSCMNRDVDVDRKKIFLPLIVLLHKYSTLIV